MITLEGLAQIEANKSFRDGAQFAWDSTSLKTWDECPRKYYLSNIEGWRLRGKSVHLRFGGHYATALEHYHKHRAAGDTLDEALMKVVREALEDTWDERQRCEECDGRGWFDVTERTRKENPWAGHVDSAREDCETCECRGQLAGTGHPWDSGVTDKTRGNLIRTIIWYIDNFADDPARTVILSSGKPAVELSFSFEVDNGIWLAGHMDRLVDMAEGLYVQDQKTTKYAVDQHFFDGFTPDVQMSLYAFAGKTILGTAISGVMIDAAQIMVGFTRFGRGFAFRSESALNEWYDETMIKIELAQHYTREQHFPMNTTSCGNYGGCPFRRVCSRPASVRSNFLAADFDRLPSWDPLTRR